MMAYFGERLMCKPCCHQAEVDAAQPKRPSALLAMIRTWGVLLIVVAVVIYCAALAIPFLMQFTQTKKPVAQIPPEPAKAQAAKDPIFSMAAAPSEGSAVPEGWQLGPNACLVERNDSSIVCITGVAKPSSLGAASPSSASKNPTMPRQPEKWSFYDISRMLTACHLTDSDGNATFTKLLPESRSTFERGIVIFGEPSGVVPKYWHRFQMRDSPYPSGMTVTVLARDPKTGARVPLEAMVASNNLRQNVATLTADQILRIGHRGGEADESLLTLSQPYSAAELIGAPVVDISGHLAAVITVALAPTDQSGRATDFIAYGIHGLKSLASSTPGHK
jgi:hypothetical protein